MILSEIISHLESIAPPSYQESYDNSGLITGNNKMQVTGILVALDCIEAIVDEAIVNKCNLIVAHHPIVFSGLKKINGKNYVERVLIKAIKNDIAIYAIHTNLDNVLSGVNSKICEKLGLKNCRILSPKRDLLRKFVTYCPADSAEKVREALWNVGAGHIGNYSEVSFNLSGTGTYKGNENSNPAVGEKGKLMREPEERIEIIYTVNQEADILAALRSSHPYEEIAYELIPIENAFQNVGSGMIGELEKPVAIMDFLRSIKTSMNTAIIRYTPVEGKMVSKVAVCGGSGSFLLKDAISAGADVFVSADFKYHQFFDGEGKIVIADIGHFESEQFTIDLLNDNLKQKFPTFAIRKTGINTNPITYFT
ncbi:MAG TPA: Nif3-like dinuclear metal center hexameric protein [Bacteroidia bacterium]|nr:Nif3-like dinuclear metal center hexameric protein [Bacteroidia bacterium]